MSKLEFDDFPSPECKETDCRGPEEEYVPWYGKRKQKTGKTKTQRRSAETDAALKRRPATRKGPNTVKTVLSLIGHRIWMLIPIALWINCVLDSDDTELARSFASSAVRPVGYLALAIGVLSLICGLGDLIYSTKIRKQSVFIIGLFCLGTALVNFWIFKLSGVDPFNFLS